MFFIPIENKLTRCWRQVVNDNPDPRVILGIWEKVGKRMESAFFVVAFYL
jgi:hypothetical protein